MKNDGMWKPALIGGVLLGVLSALPVLNVFNCFCCAWVIAGGVLAAHLYVRDSPVAVTLGSGVVLGLLTGVIGGLTASLFSIPLQIMLRSAGTGFAQQVSEWLGELPDLPPETRELLMSVLAASGNPSMALMLLTGLLNIFIFAVVGMGGGVLGVALFEKRQTAATPEPYRPPVDLPPPPPPPAGSSEL